jgi:osmotically inducible protein OsmC
MPTSKAQAVWEGGFKSGKGHFSASSGAFSAPYSVGTRFEGTPGTNPEELLAAAQAACLSMALSLALEGAGHTPTSVTTDAACTIGKVGDGFRITDMKLTVRGVVPGMDQAAFQQVAKAAADGCPIAQALKGNVKVELDAQLG